MLLTLPDGRDALVSDHALGRWHELVCPLRPQWWAVALLASVVEMAGALSDDPPAWVTPAGRESMQSYLLAGDFAFIVAPRRLGGFIVVTTIARGELPTTARQARNHANQAKRRIRAARRRRDLRLDRSWLRDERAPVYDRRAG